MSPQLREELLDLFDDLRDEASFVGAIVLGVIIAFLITGVGHLATSTTT